MSAAPLLHAALALDGMGLRVIPVGADRKPPPGFLWSTFRTKRASPHDLRRWFGADRLAGVTGIAVLTGTPSGGVVVRDFDNAAGIAEYDAWVRAHTDLARTLPTVRTPSGGVHVYLAWPGVALKYVTDVSGAPAGELRGEGGYVLAPPSITKEGTYSWVVPIPATGIPTVNPAVVGLWTGEEAEMMVPDRDDAAREQKRDRKGQKRAQAHRMKSEAHPSHVGVGGVSESDRTAPEDALLLSAADPIIRQSLPKHEGERERCLWMFVRRLKAVPLLANLAGAALHPVAREWFRLARPIVGTKTFADTWAAFLRCWRRVKYPAGNGALAIAAARALDSADPAWVGEYGDPIVTALVKLCIELQRIHGDAAPLFLGVRSAAQCIGTGPTHANNLLNMLVADGVLALVEKGGQSHNARKASRYRFVGPPSWYREES